MRRVKPLIKLFIRPLLVILAVFMAALTVSTTLARYVRGTDKVPNNFTSAGSVNPSVDPKDWTINVGETGYPVYVRAVVIISWKSVENENENEDDVVYVKPIEGTDYEIEYNLADWQPIENTEKNETYYYYVGSNDDSPAGVVKSNGTTTNLMTFNDKNTKPPFDGYKLNVEVIVQTVQAAGKADEDNPNGEIPAWWDAWGFGKNPLSPDTESGSG